MNTYSLLVVFALVGHASAAPPVVSNVIAAQRSGTKMVDIHYDLADADGDLQTIAVQVSADGGLTYTIPCVTLTGHVGPGVSVGSNKFIQWNAGVDWNGQFVAATKVRVTAYDGTTPPPPPGMAYIPAGPFLMGDNFNEIGADTLPVHIVQLDGFFMDKFEVTKELWQAVQIWGQGHGYSISTGSYVANGHPVQTINWYDMVKWCNARSEKEGRTPCYYTDTAQTIVYRTGNTDVTNAMVKWTASSYRLPTEAEWEKAARGGALGYRYPWGNTITGSQGNYIGSGDPRDAFSPGTEPVGYYNSSQVPAGVDMANGYGLYDVAGNVYEWCWDWYGSAFYGDVSANNNPHGPTTGSNRVLRGGAWVHQPAECRCASRSVNAGGNVSSGSGNSVAGFRCARGL